MYNDRLPSLKIRNSPSGFSLIDAFKYKQDEWCKSCLYRYSIPVVLKLLLQGPPMINQHRHFDSVLIGLQLSSISKQLHVIGKIT